MGRWEPNARERLAQAAMELYGDLGYEETTVARIAERAGLTERTFFRHFADKREVLFAGTSDLEEAFAQGIIDAPASASPMEAVAHSLQAASAWFAEHHAYARQRQGVINAHLALRERELIKMAGLAQTLVAALHERGVPEPAASLAAEAGIAVFRVSFERWTASTQDRPLTEVVEESLTELRAVTGGT